MVQPVTLGLTGRSGATATGPLRCCISPSRPAAEQGLDASLQVGSGKQGRYGDRLELLGSGQHLGIEPAQLADRRLILPELRMSMLVTA